jgi:transcriptional regulator with PAS, ATPase and Fis domain
MRKGRFELADGGTLSLDEIGDMSADTQAKVLRCLQEQEFEHVGGSRTIRVDVRVIAATNHDLVQAMEKGEFREDLYYRLNVVTLCLPPLRDRKEDIPELAADLLRRFSRELKKPIQGLTGEVQRAFAAYSWPGNIRELSNVIERAVALSETDEVTLGDLPAAIARPGTAPQTDRSTSAVFTLPEPLTYQDAIEVAKKEALRVALAATQNNQSRAAELLGIERSYLSRLMKQYGMR